jgi:hypothetical protein
MTIVVWRVRGPQTSYEFSDVPMTNPKYVPTIITGFRERAHLVRQQAPSDLGFLYDESPVVGRDDLIRFSFKQMDDDATTKLAVVIPSEVYANNAIVGGGPPPGV